VNYIFVKIYLIDVSTGCLYFEIYQEDTRRVSVVLENKKEENELFSHRLWDQGWDEERNVV